jgi:hypothetical protein
MLRPQITVAGIPAVIFPVPSRAHFSCLYQGETVVLGAQRQWWQDLGNRGRKCYESDIAH